MKKWMIAVAIVSMVSLFGFGVVMAQDTLPGNPVKPSCPNCPFGGPGYAGNQVLHEDMGSALADVLGISVENASDTPLENSAGEMFMRMNDGLA